MKKAISSFLGLYKALREWIFAAVLLALLVIASTALYRWSQAQMAEAIYQERLEDLIASYSQLEENYNQVVAKTTVTELEVKDSKLSVHIKRADGVTQTIPTNLDPTREIYVDYLVIEGRLWIRRLFDDQTSPSEGVLIDPSLSGIDYGPITNRSYGKAVYRHLSPGQWIVTVTGNGALGLEKKDRTESLSPLAYAPQIEDYQSVKEGLDASISEITLTDTVRWVSEKVFSTK